ncbi:hypothetical protein [Rosistilla oblonga]|uniref:hypothetical protein n=1 Tax=Rosistilla oblonga TaxID=2527990 RepID=UPI003A96EDA7
MSREKLLWSLAVLLNVAIIGFCLLLAGTNVDEYIRRLLHYRDDAMAVTFLIFSSTVSLLVLWKYRASNNNSEQGWISMGLAARKAKLRKQISESGE